MSYIRSTSNPEKLYIYPSGENVHIHHKPGEAGTTVPRDQWEALIGLEGSTDLQPAFEKKDHPDLKVKEVWELEDGSIVDEYPNTPDKVDFEDTIECHRKIALYYKDKLVCTMWKVTWYYICH